MYKYIKMANISQKWLKEMNSNELEVFGIFSNDYNRQFHGNEASKQLKMPQRSVLRKLDKLCFYGALKFIRIGKNKVYSINWENPAIFQFLILTESYKAINFLLRNSKIAIILNEINCGKVIFGSYARNINTKNSDLDVILLCKENKKIKDILDKSSLEIHVQFSTQKELEKKLKDKDALAIEIANNHIILDDFDNIIKIFMKYHKK